MRNNKPRRTASLEMTSEEKKKKAEQHAQMNAAHHDFEKKLNLHAFFKVHDRALSEEMVQDTFMKTWAYLVKGGKIDTMKAFLYHVLNNLVVDQYRKKKTASLDILIEKGYEPSVDESERLINFLDGTEAITLILKLPVTYQRVMRMRHVQDLTLEEISANTGQTKNAVAVQLHRGLEKLKVLYSHSNA